MSARTVSDVLREHGYSADGGTEAERVAEVLAELVSKHGAMADLLARATNAEKERDEADRAARELERLGFRRCDVEECNCGGWHQHRPTVVEESLRQQVEALTKERDHWREEHEKRRGEALAAQMVEQAAQDRAESMATELSSEREHRAYAVESTRRAETQVEALKKERDEALAQVKELEALAYLGDHHHQDLIYKARADELRTKVAALEAERDSWRKEYAQERREIEAGELRVRDDRIVALEAQVAIERARVTSLEKERDIFERGYLKLAKERDEAWRVINESSEGGPVAGEPLAVGIVQLVHGLCQERDEARRDAGEWSGRITLMMNERDAARMQVREMKDEVAALKHQLIAYDSPAVAQNLRAKVAAGIEHLDEFGHLGLIEGIDAMWWRMSEYRAKVAALEKERDEALATAAALEKAFNCDGTEWPERMRRRLQRTHEHHSCEACRADGEDEAWLKKQVAALKKERDEAQRKLFEYHTYPEREIEVLRAKVAELEEQVEVATSCDPAEPCGSCLYCLDVKWKDELRKRVSLEKERDEALAKVVALRESLAASHLEAQARVASLEKERDLFERGYLKLTKERDDRIEALEADKAKAQDVVVKAKRVVAKAKFDGYRKGEMDALEDALADTEEKKP